MPDKKKNIDYLIENLRIGISKVESGNFKNPYEARPPLDPKTGKRISSATGKYQFLKSWLKDTKNATGKKVKGIASFAKDSGLFGDVNNMEDFRQSPELQEAYFSYYAKNVLLPEAEKIMTKNPANLSIDQISATLHFQGYPSARRQIQSGEFDGKTKTNVSSKRYLDVYNKELQTKGRDSISTVEYSKVKSETASSPQEKKEAAVIEKEISKNKDAIIKDFEDRNKKIDQSDIPKGAKESLRKKLFSEAVANGTEDIINEYIENQNKISSENNLQEKAEFEELISVAEKIRYKIVEDSNGNKALKPDAILPNFKSGDRKQYQKLVDKYGIAGSSNKSLSVNASKLFSVIGNKYKNLTGETFNFDVNDQSNKDISTGIVSLFNVGPGKEAVIDFKEIAPYQNIKKRQVIDREMYPEAVKKRNEKISPPEEPNEEISEKTDDKGKVKGKVKDPEENSESTGLASQFYSGESQLNILENKPGQADTKFDLPIDAVTGLALGLIGKNKDEKTKLPLRTEQLSDAFNNHIAQLAEKSKQGLPVEVEAAIKSKLADAHQAGLANIVNASSGNSALVLGNQGQLQGNLVKGLVDLQVADYEVKERYFQQYGDALMYENDFDSRRDIANHSIRYQEASRKKTDARELASAGFSKMIEGIRYQKENGPGSTNDMYRSYMMQQIFGFDPKMKDNGLGDTKGTKSYFEKGKAKALENKKIADERNEIFQALSPESKKLMDVFVENNTNSDDVAAYALQMRDDELARKYQKKEDTVVKTNVGSNVQDNEYSEGLTDSDQSKVNNNIYDQELTRAAADKKIIPPGLTDEVSLPKNNSGPPPALNGEPPLALNPDGTTDLYNNESEEIEKVNGLIAKY